MPGQSKFWGGVSFCLITGASRGIGQALAVEFSKMLGKDSTLLLMARTTSGLDATKGLVTKASPDVKVFIESVDLAAVNEPLKYLDSITGCLIRLGKKATDFEHAIIVHNAASPGSMIPVTQMEQPSDLQSYLNFNVVSPICLNAHFLKVFSQEAVSRRTVVQITSYAAQNAFPTTSQYCAAKAARDIMFKSLALEEPKISVLSYAPGIVATKLLGEFMSAFDPSGKADINKAASQNKNILTPTMAAQKLVKILEDGRYTSGDHVDYYEDPNTYTSFS